MFTTITRWITRSSTNPAKDSLTIKGILIGTIPTLMVIAGLAHLNVGSDQLTAIIDGVALIVQTFLTLISAVVTTYGLIRKLLNTITVYQQTVEAPVDTFQG